MDVKPAAKQPIADQRQIIKGFSETVLDENPLVASHNSQYDVKQIHAVVNAETADGVNQDPKSINAQQFINQLSDFKERSKFLNILKNIEASGTEKKIAKLIHLCLKYGQDPSSLNGEEKKIIGAIEKKFGEDFISIISFLPSIDRTLARLELQDPLTKKTITSYAKFFDLTKPSLDLFINKLSNFDQRSKFLIILNNTEEERVQEKVAKLINLCKQRGQDLSLLNDEEEKIIEAIEKNFGEDFIDIIAFLPSHDNTLAKFKLQDPQTKQPFSSYAKFFDLTKPSLDLFIKKLSSFDQRSKFLIILNNTEGKGIQEKVAKLINLCEQRGQDLSLLNDEEKKIIEAIEKNFGEDFIRIISFLPSNDTTLAKFDLQDPLTDQPISSYAKFFTAEKANATEEKKASEIQAAQAVKNFILNLDEKLFKLPVQDLIAVLKILKADKNNPLHSMSENELQNLTKILREGIIASLEPSDLHERLRRETKVLTEPEVIQELNNDNIDTGRDAILAAPISIQEILAPIEALDKVISQSSALKWSKLRELFTANAVNSLWMQYKEISNDRDARANFSQQIKETLKSAPEGTLVKKISTKFIKEEAGVIKRIGESLDKKKREAWKTEYGLILPDEIPQLNLSQALTIVRSQEQKDLLLPAGTGSGKTLAAIATSRFNNSKFTLVFTPAAIKEQWVENLNKFTNEDSVHVLNNDLKEVRKLDHLIENAKNYQGKQNLYFVIPYSYLSQNYSPELVEKISSLPIDFIVADESHYLKDPTSQTAINTKNLISNLREQYHKAQGVPLRTLSMTATPVLASIDDAKNTWETVTGKKIIGDVQQSLQTQTRQIREEIIPSTLPGNQTHNEFPINFRLGFGPNREENLIATFNIDENPNKDGTRKDILNRILNSQNPSQLEAALVRAKALVIANHCDPQEKTIIYTNYLDNENLQNHNIIDELKDALRRKFREDQIAILTGKSKEGLKEFKNDANKKVLIMSPTSMYGIDGLQNVCSRMIIASLPWTTALDQVIGRLARKGQSKPVEVIIPSARIQLDDGYLPDYDLMKMNIIKSRQRIANAFLNGGSLESVLPSESRLMSFIQKRIEALEPADLINQALADIDSAEPLSEGVELSSEEPILNSNKTLYKYPNFFKYHSLLKCKNSEETHKLFTQASKGIEFWHAYHDDLDRLHGDKVRPMDKLIWEIMRRPSYYLKNGSENSEQSATIVNMGCGRDLLQERAIQAPTKEAGSSLQNWLKARCKINELNIYDIDHVSIKKDLKSGDSSYQISSISDNAAGLSQETLEKIESSGGADLVTFSLSLLGKDWEYAIIQAGDILKSKGKILIVDQDQVWSNERKEQLTKTAKDLGMTIQEKHQGTVVMFILAKKNDILTTL
ncbi:MAG: DEAD/DEAH box helicase family protein [Vampirovibrionia bacterium]